MHESQSALPAGGRDCPILSAWRSKVGVYTFVDGIEAALARAKAAAGDSSAIPRRQVKYMPRPRRFHHIIRRKAESGSVANCGPISKGGLTTVMESGI